jgi:hypothetical protein
MKKCIYSKAFLLFFFLCFFIIAPLIHAQKTEIQTENGVTVVYNSKDPSPKNGLKLRIVFEEELSIGEFEGDENYMFTGNIFFTTDNEGNFYVADMEGDRILKYDSGGKYLLTIGREGQGPGEFRTLSVPRFDKDNNLYITDGGNRRISFFDKEGKFLRQMLMPESYENLYINSKGMIAATKTSSGEETNVQKTIFLFSLLDDKFNSIAEIYKDEIDLPLPTGRDVSSIAKYVGNILSKAAFRPFIKYAVADDDSIYFGYPDKYEIHVYSPEGKLTRKIVRDYEPIPIGKKDKESFAKVASEEFSGPVFTDDLKKIAFEQIKYPKYKPAYQSFSLMENGWLAVSVDSVESEYTLFDIFDQEGRYIAHFKTTELTLPAEGIVSEFFFFFKNGKAYAVATEDDYRFVKRYNFEIQEYKDNKWVRKNS